MKNNNNIGLAIISMSSTGLCFGMWQENIFAGMCAVLVTFYAFMFRYDKS